jgi:hypothetical protein
VHNGGLRLERKANIVVVRTTTKRGDCVSPARKRQNRLRAELLAEAPARQAQGPWTDLALHTLGWKAFQDLCAHVCAEILKRPVEIYREAKDGGQDAAFLARRKRGRKTGDVATIQCKFSSKADRTLKPGDLQEEEANILSLTAAGLADIYVLMTSMSVPAASAVAIKARLRQLGVQFPHVFGKEFLTRAIRGNVKLRALVPRVYGLGDLSMILDERRAQQTRALLGHMLPTLKIYVPTRPHVNAIHTLADHGIVLLLGDPATGKSTIAAILATIAIEDIRHRCYKADGPEELLKHWNPNESGGFYWIDDAFGANQMREDYVDRWISIIPKVQAAIDGGNRFVLTSRRHIYETAKPKLGSRNHPLFRDEQAIVNVGKLTQAERRQILYNHIKMGSQSRSWRSQVKPRLDAIASEQSFLPEIARRLADPAYTQHVSTDVYSLLTFVREPKEHLVQTIQELSKPHRAALTLVFLHRGRMPVGGVVPEMQQLILKHFAVDPEVLGHAILELRDSFLVQKTEQARQYLTFKHPTISDALRTVLGETEGMAELYLRGAQPEAIITEAVCHGASQSQDGVIIPGSLDELVAERLSEAPDEPGANRLLLAFLAEGASDTVFRALLNRQPGILTRKAYGLRMHAYDPKINAHARALRLGLLTPELRQETGARLESAIIEDNDASFLDNDEILGLIYPTRLVTLTGRVREELLTSLPEIISETAKQADLDIDPEDNFDDIQVCIDAFSKIFEGDERAKGLLEEAETAIIHAIDDVKRARALVKDDIDNDEWDWHRDARSGQPTNSGIADRFGSGEKDDRSIFTDVDE